MSEKELFLAQVQKLVAWLNTCQLPDVRAGRDVQAHDYNERFFKWLTVRFRTKHGRKENGINWQLGKTAEERGLLLNTTPQMWIAGLKDACMCLHEVGPPGNSRLLLIEMTDNREGCAPVQHRPYYDKMGVFNLEFICSKHDADTTGCHEIRLTDVGQGTYGVIGSKCFWGGVDYAGKQMDTVDCSENEYMHGLEYDGYGTPTTKDCGSFEEDVLSDYLALYDEHERLLLIVHRIATVPAQSYRQRDPVAYARKKAAYRVKLAQYFGLK